MIFKIKITAISRNLKQLGQNFALHSGTNQDMRVQNIIGISTKLRVLGSEQRLYNTFGILQMWRQRLQTIQTHMVPHFIWDLNISIHSQVMLWKPICVRRKDGTTRKHNVPACEQYI